MKGKKKVFILCILLIGISLLFSGCWDSKEINEIAIVSAIALDKSEDGQILMSVVITNPEKISNTTSGSGSQQSTLLLSEKGKGIMDICREIQKKVPKQLFFSHLRVIVMSEKLARDGVTDVLDFFTRYREANLRPEIVFTKSRAVDLLKIDTGLEKIPSESIRKKIKLIAGGKNNLLTFFQSITEEGIEAQAPEFETVPFEVDKETDTQSKDTGEEKMAVGIKGTAVFKDYKLIGWLEDEKIKGVVNLCGSTQSGIIHIDIPEEKGGGFVSVIVPKSSTQISPDINEGNLEADVNVKLEGRLYEDESNLDLSDPEVIHYLENLAKDTLNQEVRAVLNKVQKELNSDIYGFGAAFHRKYSKEWDAELSKHWNEIFPDLTINLNIDVSLARIGFLTVLTSMPME